jgi:hypothetical protein
MLNINKYLTEKLHLNRDIKLKGNDYWTSEADNYENMPNDFFDKRKSTRKENDIQKNRPWYAVYVLLKEKGPLSKDEIREIIWPGKSGQQAELFMGLRDHGIIHTIKSGPDKGKYEVQDYKEWMIPSWRRYPLWK